MKSLTDYIPLYLGEKRKLSSKSRKTYAFVLNMFLSRYKHKAIEDLTHNDLNDFISHLEKENYATRTINLAVTAAVGFFEWASFTKRWTGSISDIHYIATEGKPSLIISASEYDHEALAGMVEWAARYSKYDDILDRRDAFMILTASSTGGRLGKELCQLKRGQVNWETGRAIVIGKGNKEGKLLFSIMAINAGKHYLKLRASLDGKSGQPLASLPLFSRHNGNEVKPLGYSGAYKALKKRFEMIFGKDKRQLFHPHLLRHEFVTRILIETGNLKLAQKLARHANIDTTQRYAHLSEEDEDRAHAEIFNR